MNSDRTIGFEDDNDGDLTLKTRLIAQDIEADTEDHGDEEGPLADELLEHIEQAEVDEINEALRIIDNTALEEEGARGSAHRDKSQNRPPEIPDGAGRREICGICCHGVERARSPRYWQGGI